MHWYRSSTLTPKDIALECIIQKVLTSIPISCSLLVVLVERMLWHHVREKQKRDYKRRKIEKITWGWAMSILCVLGKKGWTLTWYITFMSLFLSKVTVLNCVRNLERLKLFIFSSVHVGNQKWRKENLKATQVGRDNFFDFVKKLHLSWLGSRTNF